MASQKKTEYSTLESPALVLPGAEGGAKPGVDFGTLPVHALKPTSSLQDVMGFILGGFRQLPDKFVDLRTETSVLEAIGKIGVPESLIREALALVVNQEGYLPESEVRARVLDVADSFLGDGGPLDQRTYNGLVRTCEKAAKGRRSTLQCRGIVMDLIEEQRYQISKPLFSDWYAAEKKKLGLG